MAERDYVFAKAFRLPKLKGRPRQSRMWTALNGKKIDPIAQPARYSAQASSDRQTMWHPGGNPFKGI
jgi:hypothetical protein